MSIFQAISDRIRETLGDPVRLRRLLGDRPDFKADLLRPRENIALRQVTRWHHLYGANQGLPGHSTRPFELKGWRKRENNYGSFSVSCPALGALVRLTIFDAWSCDLQDVHGFAASKSKLVTFSSMDAMVLADSKEMIDEVSAANLRKNLAHREIRVTGASAVTDFFEVHQWDGRLFLVNEGGSHHLAAAKYIAARINAAVPLRAALHYYSLDLDAVAWLRSA